MFLTVILLLVYLLSVIFSFRLIIESNVNSGRLSLFFCFLFAQSLYIIPPIIDQLSNSIHYPHINLLVLYTSCCTIAFCLGGLLTKSYIPKQKISFDETNLYWINQNISKYEKIFLISIFIGSAANIFYIYQLYNLLGLDPLKWFSAYLSQETDDQIFGKFQVWSIGVIAGMAILSYSLSSLNKKLFLLYFFIFLIVLFSLVVRGNRNFLMICFFPMLLLFLSQRKLITPFNSSFAFILFIFAGQILDIIRAVGFGSLEDLNSDVFFKGISAGEFGAVARSFDFYVEGYFKKELLLGKSYLIDPVLNMLTTVGFNHQVLSYELAVAMSPRKVLFGYGFSPQLESVMNFGLIFGPLAYFLFGILLNLFDRMKGNNFILYVIFFLMAPLLVNMQRIDFAVIIKLFTIPVFFIFAVSLLARITLRDDK